VDFAVGSVDVGPVDGFAAPGGHFDVGAGWRNVRLQLELDAAMWTDEDAPKVVDPTRPASGSYTRLGAGARYYWLQLDGALRPYVEVGVGRQWIAATAAHVARNDVELGFGLTQEQPVGKFLVGGNFGLRVVLANPVDDATPLCRGTTGCGDRPAVRHLDMALFYVFGFGFGR
ncbi:MAG: hypothetical protein NT062_21895, partial [Proteobacteria bacterium]|nr:hypothetical protein [Pseudomonadota bacterium]